MKVEEALEIVLELARENALDPKEAEGEELKAEAARQETALATLEDFYTNVLQECLGCFLRPWS